jgi:hypothetical protein
MNLMTPERAKKAASLIRSGEIVELGHTLSQTMPFFGTRRFDLHQKQQFNYPQANRFGANEEIVVTEIGRSAPIRHVPAHHDRRRDLQLRQAALHRGRGGFREMGVDTVGTIFTRGVLVDIAGLKGVPVLGDDYEITVADIEQALQRQNTRIERATRCCSTPAGARSGAATTRATSGAARASASRRRNG